ncbi:phospholipase D-like domain-containing protein [uncultured Helicobacter sp.]|uniref:phospholipase D-like domain-containing protein n=1 Tax=uncultured Helicobacter sp. TaxID=175537 RepID=UPI00374E468A
MWIKKCFLCVMCLFALGYGQENLYMLPYENTEALKSLLTHIKNAKININISIYSFTNREIAKALRDTAQKGVKITIIYDKSANLKNDTSTIGYLAKYKNIEVCTLEGKSAPNYAGIMHQKIAIIDDKILIVGSANWSKSAFAYNYETLLITQNPSHTHKANQYFAHMAKECQAF